MKKLIFNIITVCALFVLTSCTEEAAYPTTPSIGYLECQYDYKIKVNGVETTKQAYTRSIITDVAYALYENNTLDSVYIKKGFRRVELYLYSKECNPDSVNQPLGASYAQISLIDSLGLDPKPDRVLNYAYTIGPETNLGTSNKPMCSAISAKIQLVTDTLTNLPAYKYNFSGQVGKKVTILSLGNEMYQIMAYGVSNTKIYNIYYYGKIRAKNKIK